MYGVYDHIMAPLGRGIYAVAAAMYAVAARFGKAMYDVAARVAHLRRCRRRLGLRSPRRSPRRAVASAAYGVAEASPPLTVMDAATRDAISRRSFKQ